LDKEPDMTDHVTTAQTDPLQQATVTFPLGAWVRANAFGLGLAMGLFASVGGVMEAMGAAHESVARNLPAVLAMAVGGILLAWMRRRALAALATSARWHAPLIGICVPAGMILGLGTAPFDMIMALLLTGTAGGALQLRRLRPVGARSVLVSVGSWLVGAALAIVAVILVMDGILGGLVSVDFEAIDADGGATSVVLFALAYTVVGLVGGAVGSTIEGLTTHRRMRRSG
jgi:hypothetical protein